MTAYTIENLTKKFDGRTVLNALTLEAKAAEFLVILGPTGAGKTTLLRTLAGLEHPTAGTILQDQTDITHRPPAQRDMAMVFQNFSLYPRLSVFDNLAFGLRPKWRAIDKNEIDRRVRWAADLLGLSEKLSAKPTQLSGGQQQRVAIGRAIVREPKLFLFDEPLASLDAKLRESMILEIHRLQRRLSVTMLYVTHDQTEAMALADRIAVLDNGRLLQIATPAEIYSHPLTPRVAQLLGSPPINLLTPADAAKMFSSLNLPSSITTIGIRPEHLQLTASNTGPATTTVIEHLGPTTLVHLAIGPLTVRATLPPNAPVRINQKFSLCANPGDFLFWSH